MATRGAYPRRQPLLTRPPASPVSPLVPAARVLRPEDHASAGTVVLTRLPGPAPAAPGQRPLASLVVRGEDAASLGLSLAVRPPGPPPAAPPGATPRSAQVLREGDPDIPGLVVQTRAQPGPVRPLILPARVLRSDEDVPGQVAWARPPLAPPKVNVAGGVLPPAVVRPADPDAPGLAWRSWLPWAPVPPPAPTPAPVASGPPPAPQLQPAVVVDDDTEKAVLALWLATPGLGWFRQPPRTGRQKSAAGSPSPPGGDVKASGPYVVLDCKLERRDGQTNGTDISYLDRRRVTLKVYGQRDDAVMGAGLIRTVFNGKLGLPGRPTLTYPSGARFMMWQPLGEVKLEEDRDTKAGRDVWVGAIEAIVWSVRAE